MLPQSKSKSEIWYMNQRASSTPGPVQQMGRRNGAVIPQGEQGSGRGVAKGNQGISAPAHLVTSQPLHLPPGLTQSSLQRIPPPQQAARYKQPKGSPISHASSSLPADCANSHVDPGLFLELSFPVFKLLLPPTPQPPQGLTLPPSRQLTDSCYLNLGNNSKCSKPCPSPSEGKQ